MEPAVSCWWATTNICTARSPPASTSGPADYVAWLLGATGAYAVKIVNPGGIEAWKRRPAKPQRYRSGRSGGSGHTAGNSRDADQCGERARPAPPGPHPLQQPGPGRATARRRSRPCRRVEGRRAHFTHLQFHSYGGEAGRGGARGAPKSWSMSTRIPSISVDVGQVMFGAGHDAHRGRRGRVSAVHQQRAEVGQHRHRARDRLRHRAVRVQGEGGRRDAAVGRRARAVSAGRRSVARGPVDRSSERRVVPVLSRADPAAHGSLVSRRAAQARQIRSCWPGARWPTGSRASTRSNEIAIVTRAGPARLLGLAHKGHLGVGADADVTVYARDADIAKMFATPRYVRQRRQARGRGRAAATRAAPGRRLHVRPAFDEQRCCAIVRRHFDAYSHRGRSTTIRRGARRAGVQPTTSSAA